MSLRPLEPLGKGGQPDTEVAVLGQGGKGGWVERDRVVRWGATEWLGGGCWPA